MAQKPSIPKGTRDFTPIEAQRREYIFDTVKSVFKLFGYQPIETPAMENLSTLLGKYGDEGDKLLFKILNSGDFTSSVNDTLWSEKNAQKLSTQICEKGLRYDLTVPFARFVVQNRNELSFPFKRYQIQPVWRADRPQKGRYREFFQCDVDVVGSDSLLNELELIQITEEVYRKLNLDVTLKINNRKILAGIADAIGFPEMLTDITVAIDKLDKISLDEVKKELLDKGLSQTALDKLEPIIQLSGHTKQKIEQLKPLLEQSEIGLKGIEEIETVFSLIEAAQVELKVELDISLARGLNYYTGAIFEVKSNEVQIGSITGGGRYDNLTGIFGMPDVSGVGISFGADRIYDVLLQTSKFPEQLQSGTQVLFINMGTNESIELLGLIKNVRQAGFSTELYPTEAKMKKQFSYADQKKIPLVVIRGENEKANNTLTLKNMASGTQTEVNVAELIRTIGTQI